MKKRLMVHVGDNSAWFDTSSAISKKFFYPFYQDGESLEPNVIPILFNKMRKDSVFLDIGAYVGSYAIVVSKAYPQCSVHAFEMNPFLIGELRKNARLNHIGNLILVCAAVWDVNGLAVGYDVLLDGDNSTNSIQERTDGSFESVTSLRIDSYCEQMRLKPNVVKIDVEGAEVRVLRGMGNVLNSIEALFLEIHPAWLGRYNNTMNELADILLQQKFKIRVVMNRRVSNGTELLPVEDLLELNANVMLICER